MRRVAEALGDVIVRVSREYARKYIEADDLAQEVWLDVLAHADDYRTLVDHNMGLAVRRVQSVAGRIIARERVRAQHRDGQYYYEPEYVRLFLPFYYDHLVTGDGWRTAEAADTAIDIEAAWPYLRRWQSGVIDAAHATPRPSGEMDWQAVADATERSSAHTAEIAYSKAVTALAVEMNDRRAWREIDALKGRDGAEDE
jgi:hypothetical protein